MHYYEPVQQPDLCQSLRECRTSRQVAICNPPFLGRTLPLTLWLGGRARHSARAVSAQS